MCINKAAEPYASICVSVSSTDPIDDPTKLGPVVADLLANARRNSGIDGQPGTWPQPQD